MGSSGIAAFFWNLLAFSKLSSHQDARMTATTSLSDSNIDVAGLPDLENGAPSIPSSILSSKEPTYETDPVKSANLEQEAQGIPDQSLSNANPTDMIDQGQYNGQETDTQHSSEAKLLYEILALLKRMVGQDAVIKAEKNFAIATLFASAAAILGLLTIAIQGKITSASILFVLCLNSLFAIFLCALLMLVLIHGRPKVKCFTKFLKILSSIILGLMIGVMGFLAYSFIVGAIHQKSEGQVTSTDERGKDGVGSR